MDSTLPNVCPGCGKAQTPPFAKPFVCAQCGEELYLTSDNKLFLAHPVDTYSLLAEKPGVSQPDTTELGAARAPTLGEIERKQSSIGLANQKIAMRKKESRRLLMSGLALLGLGILLFAITLARWLLSQRDWVALAVSGLGMVVLVCSGIYLSVSSILVRRLLRKYEQELGKELEHLEAELERSP